MTDNQPQTFAGQDPASLVERYAYVRPFYHVPTGPSSFESVRAKWCYRVKIVEARGGMALVRHVNSGGPWNREALHFLAELHMFNCHCPACVTGGEGLDSRTGA